MIKRSERIGFIGLGVMGSLMATHLLKDGFNLALYDIDEEKCKPLVDNDSCVMAKSPAEVMRSSSRLITMLPTSDHVDIVLFGEKGVASEIMPGDLIIEMSNGEVKLLEQQAERIKTQNATLIDAPVCLSPAEAATGDLIALVGGDNSSLEAVAGLLASLTQRVIHAGPTGFGLRLKLINNYMSMVNHLLTGEVLALAKAVGLDRPLTVDLLQNTAAGRGQLVTNYPKKVLRGDVSADFSVNMGIKDLSMAISMVNNFEENASFGILARKLFGSAADAGFGDKDCTAVLEYFDKKIAGTL